MNVFIANHAQAFIFAFLQILTMIVLAAVLGLVASLTIAAVAGGVALVVVAVALIAPALA
jgi:hypothetical protein